MKKAVTLILAAILLLSSLSLSMSASMNTDTLKVLRLPVFDEALWEGNDGVEAVFASPEGHITATAKEDSDSIVFSAELDGVDISLYNELYASVTLSGDGEEHTVNISFESESYSFSFDIPVVSGKGEAYIPIDEKLSTAITSVTLRTDNSDRAVTSITLTELTADNGFSYNYRTLFGANDVYSENYFTRGKKSVIVYPENNSVSLCVPFLENFASDKEQYDVMVWVQLKKSENCSLNARIKYKGEDDLISSPISTTTDGCYTFVIPSGYTKVYFEFTGLLGNSPVELTGAGAFLLGSSGEFYGSVSSCRFDGKKISVSGSLLAEASQYIGSKLLLFKIPISEASTSDLSELTPIAQSGFSTKFTLSAEAAADYAEYFYKVVLDTEDGYKSVGHTVVANCASVLTAPQGSVSAICGADAVDVFETNASTVILDVYAGKLLETDDIYSAKTYQYKNLYYFNTDELNALDNDLRFFDAAGTRVYLRLYSDKEGFGFDYTPANADNLSLMCAVSSFLAERYPAVKGFIVGVPVNQADLSGPEKAEEKAILYSVLSECIKSKNPNAAIVLPYAEKGNSDKWLCASMISYYMKLYGAGGTVTLYEFSENLEYAQPIATRLSLLASKLGPTSDGSAILWSVPSAASDEEIKNGWHNLCVLAAQNNLRFCAVDLNKAKKATALFDELKVMLDTENVISATISRFEASAEPTEHKGTYSLWDFTSSYHTAGWVAGGSFSTPVSAKGDGHRVLSSKIEVEGAGILIARTDSPIDMTDSFAALTLQIKSELCDNADVVVIFGSGEDRVEYSAIIPCNEEKTLSCEMSDFEGAGKIDYAAIIVRGVSDATALISKLDINSKKLTDEELKSKYFTAVEEETSPILYVTVIFIAAATVTVFSRFIKRRGQGKKDKQK